MARQQIVMALVGTLSIALTFMLGTATALAFFLVGGQLALIGPYVVSRSWPLIYTLEAAFVAVVLFVVGRLLGRRLTTRRLVAIVLATWVGQYLILASGVLADELTPLNTIGFWMLATAGPLQPVAAVIGGWLGARPRGGPIAAA